MFIFFKSLTIAAFAAASLNVHADVDMFLQLDGIAGETKDDTYAKGIDVLAWSWNLSNPGNLHTTSPRGGIANIADIELTKYIDSSSTELYRLVANGGFIKSGTLSLRKSPERFVFEQIAMNDILVTSVTTGGDFADNRLTENISLNFASFCIRYVGMADGPGKKRELCWNIATSQSCTAQQIEDLFNLPLVASLPRNLVHQLTPVCSDS